MVRCLWYIPVAAGVFVAIIALTAQSPWREVLTSFVVFELSLVSVAWYLYVHGLPNVIWMRLWQACCAIVAACIVISALASTNIPHALWGFGLDLTSAALLLACLLLALLLPLFPPRPRLVALITASALLVLLWITPMFSAVPEVRPSLKATLSVALSAAEAGGSRQLSIGSGTNSFVYLWQRYAPEGVRATPFASERFPVGSSIMATLISEIGIVGVLVFALAFVARSVEHGQVFYSSVTQWRIGARLAEVFFILCPLFGLAALLFAPPSAALLFGAMVLLGASAGGGPTMPPLRYGGKILAALLVILILGALYLAFAVGFYMRAADLFSRGDLIGARKVAENSYALSGDPQAARLIATVVRTLAHETAKRKSVEEVPPLYAAALGVMRSATVREPSHADNWSLLGAIAAEQYTATRDASYFDIARGALERARTIAPGDARIPLFQGQLYLLAGRLDAGIGYLEESVMLRASDNDAVSLLESAREAKRKTQ